VTVRLLTDSASSMRRSIRSRRCASRCATAWATWQRERK